MPYVQSSQSWTYHTKPVRLTSTILAVIEAMGQRSSPTNDDRITRVESRAAALSQEFYRIRQWRGNILRQNDLRPLCLHVENHKRNSWVDKAVMPPLQFLQSVLLKLQYHDGIISLHRPFPQRSTEADAHATTTLEHAMATISLVHRLMSKTDVLHGWCEVCQWQWNALLTLISFLMTYPLCYYSATARQHGHLALEIFTVADERNIVAVRAAALTRFLCTKVDGLVELLKSASAHTTSPKTSQTGQGNVAEPAKTLPGLRFTEADYSDTIFKDLHPENEASNSNSDALWSWTDVTNLDGWPGYCDEITEVLTDYAHLPLGNDGFFSLS